MGSLKKFVDDRSAANGKVDRWLIVLDEAGFTLEDLERLDVTKAREMLKVVHPPVAVPAAKELPPMPKGMSNEQQFARWQWIYRHKFNTELDYLALGDSERPKGLARLILVAADLAAIIAVCESLFGMSLWNKEKDLGATSIRSLKKNGPYIVWVRDRREADKCNRDVRVSDLAQKDCVTLEERLLFEIVYFLETNQHLDAEYFTLCAGSRYSDGYVPGVGWLSGYQEVRVGWYDPSARNPNYAVRSAVSR